MFDRRTVFLSPFHLLLVRPEADRLPVCPKKLLSEDPELKYFHTKILGKKEKVYAKYTVHTVYDTTPRFSFAFYKIDYVARSQYRAK